MKTCTCSSQEKKRLIFACSGAADVGSIADRAARLMAKENYGKMFCLAAIGAKVPNYLQSAQDAEENIVIDGCNVFCGKKIFEAAGISFKSFLLTEMGLEKGKTPVTEEIIAEIAGKIMGK